MKFEPNIKVGVGQLFMQLELGSNSKSIWSINKGLRSGFCSASASRTSSSGLQSSAPDSDEKSRFRNWQQIRRFSAEHGQRRWVFFLLTLIQVAAISKIKLWPWNLWSFARNNSDNPPALNVRNETFWVNVTYFLLNSLAVLYFSPTHTNHTHVYTLLCLCAFESGAVFHS